VKKPIGQIVSVPNYHGVQTEGVTFQSHQNDLLSGLLLTG